MQNVFLSALPSGAHNLSEQTITCVTAFSHTSLFLERFWREFRISFKSRKPVSKIYRPKNDNLCLFKTLRFPF